MKHNASVVAAFFRSYGIPIPELEHKFHPERKWRFDYAWPDDDYKHRPFPEAAYTIRPLALEVEGGVWTGGRHTSGAGFVKDMEKYNAAAALGWRIIRVQPKDLLTKATADLIRSCLCLG